MFELAESPVSKRIMQVLSFGISLFVCGFFLFPSVSAHKTGFYLTVVLPFLVLVPWLRWRTPTKVEWLVLCFVSYLVVAALWSPAFSVGGLLYFVKCALFILILLWSVSMCVASEGLRRWLLPSFVISGLVVGLYSLIVFGVVTSWKFDQVLKPVWHFANQNRMAKVYGVLVLVVLFVLTKARSLLPFWISFSALLVSLAIVFFSRSSGALLALFMSIPCYFLILWGLKKEYKKLLYLCSLGAVLVFGVAEIIIAGGADSVYFEQGWSYRDEIWLSVINDVVRAPWFGVGADRELVVLGAEGRIYSHEHNIFFAVLRQSGAVGLGLLLILLINLCGVAVKPDDWVMSLGMMILVFGLIALSSSGEYPLERPKESWLFFWLPIALLLRGQEVHRATGLMQEARGCGPSAVRV